jgi:hypothetical protein
MRGERIIREDYGTAANKKWVQIFMGTNIGSYAMILLIFCPGSFKYRAVRVEAAGDGTNIFPFGFIFTMGEEY